VDSSGNIREIVITVDDSKFNVEVAKRILSHAYNVHTALSGKELFELLNNVTPALILLDVEMPEMDGYAVNRELKRDESTAHIPVIFLTGRDCDEGEARALSEGAVDYITKPFSADILEMRVGLHLLLQRQKRELRESAIKAEIANDAKTAFIAIMSHEMRTPLNAIIGFSELSLETADLREDLYSNLVNIRNAGTTLLSIISDILDISKIETGKFELIPTEYDTATLINDVLTQSILHKSEKPIEFNLTIDKSFPSKLFGDELRVKQILNNLLSNAFKYTPEGTVELIVNCTTEGNICWVSAMVKDSGIGISPENLLSVFDDFTQADMTANRKIVGTGLGLPIARRLAEMMDGDIKLTSEYGKGSIFTARIRQQCVSADPISPEVINALKSLRFSEQRRIESIPLMSLPNARVLVVDDVPTNLAVASGMLKRYSIKADCVSSGPEAIDAIKNESVRYNAIFMDHLMPDMNGIEATGLIREIDSDYARNIPIIAFTANAIVGNEEMFLKNGFQAFISKPIEVPQLDAIIKEWIRGNGNDVRKEESEASTPGQAVEQAPEQASFLSLAVDGIDFKKGLLRFGGDTETYFAVMRTFAQNVPLILGKVEAVTKDNLEEYTVTVHGIKGSCYGICADKAATLADALEAAGKTGDYEFITAHNTTFVENVRKLLSGIEKAIAQLQATKQKSQKDAPDPQLLEKLLDACNRHDMNDIDTIVAELDDYIYESGGELVTSLREMADEMDYAEMAERLCGIV